MKPSEIKVGMTYRNRGAGRTKRTVIAIGIEHRPKKWMGANGLDCTRINTTPPPEEPGVLWRNASNHTGTPARQTLFLSSFAKWAGSEVKEGEI